MRVGVLGAGQLGRMLALAGLPLGLEFRFLDPTPHSPAGQLAEQIVVGYDDLEVLDRFVAGLDLVTYEFENVPVECARHLAARLPVYPPPAALETAQDRLSEKRLFTQLGVPTPSFASIATREELTEAVEAIGLPAVLKTRRMGYDGKGQFVLREPSDLDAAWEALSPSPPSRPTNSVSDGVPLGLEAEGQAALILEGFVPFQRELSILAVRGRDGATACYPLVENRHREGILRLSLAPAPDLTPEILTQADAYAGRLLTELDYVGLLAVELFLHDGRLIANEMAPRVHNSGHWTIEGAETSQFENHLRAATGLPLGSTAPIGCSAMVNLIGAWPDPATVLAIPGAHLHLYGKAPRPGRKVGHITLRADAAGILQERLAQALELIPQGL